MVRIRGRSLVDSEPYFVVLVIQRRNRGSRPYELHHYYLGCVTAHTKFAGPASLSQHFAKRSDMWQDMLNATFDT